MKQWREQRNPYFFFFIYDQGSISWSGNNIYPPPPPFIWFRAGFGTFWKAGSGTITIIPYPQQWGGNFLVYSLPAACFVCWPILFLALLAAVGGTKAACAALCVASPTNAAPVSLGIPHTSGQHSICVGILSTKMIIFYIWNCRT